MLSAFYHWSGDFYDWSGCLFPFFTIDQISSIVDRAPFAIDLAPFTIDPAPFCHWFGCLCRWFWRLFRLLNNLYKMVAELLFWKEIRSVKKIYWVAWAFYPDANLSSNTCSPALQQIERSPNGAVATWDADAEESQKTYYRSGWRVWSGKSSSYTASVDSNLIFKQKIRFANSSQAFANHRKHRETKVPFIALLHGFIDPLKHVAPPPQNHWNPNTTTWRSANDCAYLCESMRRISMRFFWSHTLRVDLVASYICSILLRIYIL